MPDFRGRMTSADLSRTVIRRATLPLRKAKHAGFLGIKWAGRVPDAARRARSALTTYTYDPER